MENKTAIWTFTAALAGFLFGFDTVVISGANQPIKTLWDMSPLFHGTFIMSMALWGTVVGALFGGIPSERYGRKPTLIAIGLLFFVSAVGSGLAPNPISFSFFRFIGGLAVGASSVAAPAFIAEIASAKNRGRLVAQYQFNIVLGIFIAFLSNYLIAQIGGAQDWRWMLGVEAIPALIYVLLVMKLPESPRWLATVKKDPDAALAVLKETRSESEAKQELESILNHQDKSERTSVFAKKYRRPIVLAFLLAFFNQWSGVNFIFYYAPQILELSGFATSESLLSSISIGGINLIFTLFGMYLIDKLGRKTLLVYGSIGYIISLIGVAFAFKTGASPGVTLFFLCMFIASHAIGQGAVIWVFIAEIFPNKVRAYGQAFGSGIHWVMAAVITLLTPVFLDSKDGILKDAPWIIFAFFAGMMVLQLIWVLLKVPETKGKSLEELQENMVGE
ncbi:MAG: SP family xylose:H+ symportor-like MFS transporter [Bacteroidia bacterium]|jgi:SP family xylose:H+ symportor-like MFS transporter